MKTNMRKPYEAPRLFADTFAPDTIISSVDAMFGTGPSVSKSSSGGGSPKNGAANSCVGTNTVIGDAQGGEVCAW